jgi:hypothetical protein
MERLEQDLIEEVMMEKKEECRSHCKKGNNVGHRDIFSWGSVCGGCYNHYHSKGRKSNNTLYRVDSSI